VYTILTSLMHATCPANIIPVALITLIVFGAEYSYEARHYVSTSKNLHLVF
jgi:hypothetical protein